MKVKTKLLLGYGFCFFIVLLTAVSAFFGFSLLDNGIEKILTENYESVSASMEMEEVLERQDSLTLVLLLEPNNEPQAMRSLEKRFGVALERVKSNITIEAERAIIDSVETSYALYRQARDSLIKRGSDQPIAAYQKQTYPRFLQVKQAVQALIETNRRAMFDADQEERNRVSINSAWLGFLIVFALLSLALIFRWLNRDVVVRIEEILEVADAGVADNPGRRASVHGVDELARIGIRLNEILDRHRALVGQTDGSLSYSRQMLLALVGSYGEGFLLTGLDGRIIASNLARERDALVRTISSRIAQSSKELLAVAQQTDSEVLLPGDDTTKLRLLVAQPKRPVGWLVKVAL